MDTRGTDKRVAEMLLSEPYTGEVDDGRFHGFGRAQLIDAAGGGEYAGSFDHGRRHGTGTAVWPDGLKYIGQWQHNAATGVGCLSWPCGALYVGDVRRGNRHGCGVYRNGDCKYVGEWREGLRHGWGTQITPEYTYTGEWVDGHRHGWGSAEFSSLNRYSGAWEADKIHGRGVMLWVTLDRSKEAAVPTAQAMYKRSQRQLIANLRSKLQNVGSVSPGPLGPFTPAVAASTDTLEQYAGDWDNNQPHGRGEYQLMFRGNAAHRDVPFQAINQFKGSFRTGMRDGPGTQHFADGTTFEGTWERNLKHGKGRIHHSNGTVEEVEMRNDCLVDTDQPSVPRGGHGVMASVKVEDLLEPIADPAVREKATAELQGVVSRASNTLHHLFNVYASVACPVDYESLAEKPKEAVELPPPDHGRYINESDAHVPRGAKAIQRNAMIAAAITGSVVARASNAARSAFDVMKRCESQFNDVVASSPRDFFSPNSTVTNVGSTDDTDGVSSPLMNTATPNRGTMSGTRRPATPQVETDAGVTLESLLPDAPSPSASKAAEVRMSSQRLHALLRDAQLLDMHFTQKDVEIAIAPLRARLLLRPVREVTFSFPSFVEAIIRIADARIGHSYPFFTASAVRKLHVSGHVDYLVKEFLWPVCAALRDMDTSTEFVKTLGIDRYVAVGAEDNTVEEIRKSAVRVLRDKARITKMKDRADEAAGNSENPAFAVTAIEMDTTARLGDTVAQLTDINIAADPAIVRRIERPSSASIDVVERMDLPNGSATERISACVKYKTVVGAHDAFNGVPAPLSPRGAVQPVPGSRYGGHLEVWYFLVTIRHYSAVHYRAHAVVVNVTRADASTLLSVVPGAALHRMQHVLGAPIPSDIARHLGGTEPLRDPPTWAVRPHAPLMGHQMLRFEPVARILESRFGEAQALYAHCSGRLWHLLDALDQVGLVAPMQVYSGAGTRATRSPAARDDRLPADILLRNLCFSVLGGLVDSASSAVTSVDTCDPPPVYDSAVLRAFLRKTPELASALQIMARQKDAHRDIRDAFRNLRTAVSTAEWWSSLQQLELTLEEFCSALVMSGYFIYAGTGWRADLSCTPSADDEQGGQTPLDETLNAFETGSTISGTATTVTRKGAVAPAIVDVATTGVARAVDQFAQSWRELVQCPRRSDFTLPAACFLPGDDRDILEPPMAMAASASVVQSLCPTPREKAIDEAKPDVKEKGSKGKGPPPPPPVPASVACLHPKAKLAPRIVPVGGLGDVPPLALSRKLPVRPRSTPIEEPKKKRGAKR